VRQLKDKLFADAKSENSFQLDVALLNNLDTFTVSEDWEPRKLATVDAIVIGHTMQT
jgi:hypothetical protein